VSPVKPAQRIAKCRSGFGRSFTFQEVPQSRKSRGRLEDGRRLWISCHRLNDQVRDLFVAQTLRAYLLASSSPDKFRLVDSHPGIFKRLLRYQRSRIILSVSVIWGDPESAPHRADRLKLSERDLTVGMMFQFLFGPIGKLPRIKGACEQIIVSDFNKTDWI